MEDIGLFNQGWKWLQSKDCYSVARTTASCFRDKIGIFKERHWPMICRGCAKFGRGLLFLLVYWKNCSISGFQSFVGLGSAALLVIMWSCFMSLTSMSCLLYVLLSMGAAGAAVQYLGYTPGLFIVGLFAILILWMYANFWITGTLFIVGDSFVYHLRCKYWLVLRLNTQIGKYLTSDFPLGWLLKISRGMFPNDRFSLLSVFTKSRAAGGIYGNHVFYVLRQSPSRMAWSFLAINLAFLSNDVLNYMIKWCDNLSESTHFEEHKETDSFTEDDFCTKCEYSAPTEVETEEEETLNSCKSTTKSASPSSIVEKPKEVASKAAVREEGNSMIEMERILSSENHYEALGFPRHKKIDVVLLKKEYRKKAMLVHPDKNMGSSLASESFKKLQCAYEVLSDAVKKRDYDELLKKEESKYVMQKSASTSYQTADFCSDESRRIQCTKCGNSHIWVCTNRTKVKARWCQDCCQYHQAKDGDGWVENKGSLVFDRLQKVEIPRAFVCAESKIFDVSEWATCQGMTCRPNTHRPSFHVNMVGLEKSTQRSNSSRYPWDLDAEMTDEEDEFDIWLQQALASGLFCETSKRRKSWSPFKLPQKKGKNQWRRSS